MEDWKNWNKRSCAISNKKKKIIKNNQDTKTKTKGIKRRSGGIELVNQVLRENNKIEK